MRYRIWSVFATAFALAVSNIRSQTRKHLLGYSWAIFSPVIYAACFLIVKRGLDHAAASETDYAFSVFRAFIGVTMLQAWIQLLQEMSRLIRRHRSLLRGMDISDKPLVISILLESAFGLAIRFLTVLLALAFLGLSIPGDFMDWAWLAISLLVLLLSAAALGLVLAPWATLYPDVNKAISSANLPLMLLSPVFYSATTLTDSVLFWVNWINPIAPILATLMDAVAGQPPFYRVPLLLWLVVSLALLMLALGKLRRQVPILLERLGN